MLQFFALCVFHEDANVILDLDMDPEFDGLDVEQMLPFLARNRIAGLEVRGACRSLQMFIAR